MTKVAILPVPTEEGISYRAVAGAKKSQGSTAGQALDALTRQLSEDEANLLVVVQSLRPDRFFDAGQQQRLAELMADKARDSGQVLPADAQAEFGFSCRRRIARLGGTRRRVRRRIET